MRYKEVDAKHILTRSSLPDADYVINPYVGCEFGCSYCYASFMGRTVGESIDAWGSYVYVKRNAVELLESDLAALKDRKATILISSVTDPYQGAEARYRLTRGILEVLAADGYPGEVGILTKSSLVARDIDIIKRLPRPDVGMTITTTDDELGRFLEVRASATGARLDALKRLHDAGLRPYAFVGPLLPHFRHRPELLDELLGRIAGSGVREVYVEQINVNNLGLKPEASAQVN